MRTVADLMSNKLLSLNPHQSMFDAESLMGEKKIRHLPILNKDNELVGLLTQRTLLKTAFDITNKFGAHLLGDYMKRYIIKDFMITEVHQLDAQTALSEVGDYFLQGKHGCLIITREGKPAGILTSMDFVRLCVQLLKQESGTDYSPMP